MSAKLLTLPSPASRTPRQRGLSSVWRGHAAILRQELQSMATLLAALGEEAARRAQREIPQTIAGAWALDAANLELRGPDQTIAVTAMESKLLRALMEQPGEGISRAALLQLVTGVAGTELQLRNVDNHVMRLRRKLGPAAGHIETLRGFGFRWAIHPAHLEVLPCP